MSSSQNPNRNVLTTFISRYKQSEAHQTQISLSSTHKPSPKLPITRPSKPLGLHKHHQRVIAISQCEFATPTKRLKTCSRFQQSTSMASVPPKKSFSELRDDDNGVLGVQKTELGKLYQSAFKVEKIGSSSYRTLNDEEVMGSSSSKPLPITFRNPHLARICLF